MWDSHPQSRKGETAQSVITAFVPRLVTGLSFEVVLYMNTRVACLVNWVISGIYTNLSRNELL